MCKGYIYSLVCVKNSKSETTYLKLVPNVKLKVFLKDLPRVLHDMEI